MELYIKSKIKILRDFGIEVSEGILEELHSLCPDKLAIDRYVKRLIFEKLGD